MPLSSPKFEHWKDIVYFLLVPGICIWLGMEIQQYKSELGLASEGMKPFYRRIELKSKAYKSSLYIKRKTWGALGRHVVRVLSPEPHFLPFADSSREFIFAQAYPLIFQFQEDTLRIYHKSPASMSRPPLFDSPIPIVFQMVDSCHFEALNDSTQKGLRRF